MPRHSFGPATIEQVGCLLVVRSLDRNVVESPQAFAQLLEVRFSAHARENFLPDGSDKTNLTRAEQPRPLINHASLVNAETPLLASESQRPDGRIDENCQRGRLRRRAL